MRQMSGMAGMGGSARSNGSIKAPGNHRICCSAAYACLRSFSKWINATRPLQAMPTTQPCIPETALGDHGAIPVPDGRYVHTLRLGNHLLDRRICAFVFWIFIVCHNQTSFVLLSKWIDALFLAVVG
jgi:hypothetical protein